MAMKQVIWWLVGLLALGWELGLGLAGGRTPQGALVGPRQVLRVVDGDTIAIAGFDQTSRFIGMNTPESSRNSKAKRPRPEGAAFGPRQKDAKRTKTDLDVIVAAGKQATAVLKAMIGKKSIWVERDVTERDRYGRFLHYIYIEDANGDWQAGGHKLRQLNLELVRLGWADIATFPPNIRYVELYQQATKEAREAKRGLWGQ
jgi:micrococcal nuclease